MADQRGGHRTMHIYDGAGRLKLEELGNAAYTSMTYDAANRLRAVENSRSD
jgi:YD repeat-containing protein